MKLDEVTSIMQIWEEAKKNEIIHDDNEATYEYKFDGGERVAFSWELSLYIENKPDLSSRYATNKDLYIDYIRESHANGHIFLFTLP